MNSQLFGAPVHRYTGFNAAAIVRALGLSVGDAVVVMPDGKRLIIGADALDGIPRARPEYIPVGPRCGKCGGPHYAGSCPRQRGGKALVRRLATCCL